MASVFDLATSSRLHIEARASVRQGRDISLIVLLWLLFLSISLLKARRKLADRPAATSASQHKVSREARGFCEKAGTNVAGRSAAASGFDHATSDRFHKEPRAPVK